MNTKAQQHGRLDYEGSGKMIPWHVVIVGIDGKIIEG
jgi:hypothetical protein